jgi:geranylgeranyl diphosphate synthase type II
MDDDDLRRGQPTNHRKFGEATALLAGDALLTEAFSLIAAGYSDAGDIGLELVRLLGEAAGGVGMVAGQVQDMAMQGELTDASMASAQSAPTSRPTEKELLDMLALKTGALIRVSVEGAAVIARVPADERVALRELGARLGLAFQLADDILDYDPKAIEPSGLPAIVGLEGTQERLEKTTARAAELLGRYGALGEGLKAMIEFNLKRKI